MFIYLHLVMIIRSKKKSSVYFDIVRSGTNILIMQMYLHSGQYEELETFEYTMIGIDNI